MKIRYYLAAFAFAFVAAAGPGIVSADLSTNLVAHYPFNGNANDETGNGHDGTVYGATLTTNRFGASSSAYLLDGADDYLTLTSMPTVGAESFAISYWIKTPFNNTSFNPAIIGNAPSNSGDNPRHWIIYLAAPDENSLGFKYGHPGVDVNLSGNATITDNVWRHVVTMRDVESDTTSIYVDNVLTAQVPNWTNESVSNNELVGISHHLGRYWDGSIDDIRIYERALTDVEVTCLFEETASSTDECGDSQTVLEVSKDSTLRNGATHRNEGANENIRLQQSGKNRGIVAFDLSNVDLNGLQSAKLVLTINDEFVPAQWGTAGRNINVERLTEDWQEGNGKDFDVSPSESTRGSGSGVTWECAVDTAIENQQQNCSNDWAGADESSAQATAAPVVIQNGQTGEVQFDVTADVVAGASSGWRIRKENEGQSGNVSFYSKEGAQALLDTTLAPRLILEY